MLLKNAIEGLKDTYQSIDIRTAAYFKDKSWWAAIVVIRLRKESTQQLLEIFKKRIAKYGLIQEEEFRVDLTASKISDLPKMLENWEKNMVRHTENLAINIINTRELDYNIKEPSYHNTNNFVDDKWNSYSVSTRVGKSEVHNIVDRYDHIARKKDSRDIYEYLGSILEIPKNSAQTLQLNIITAPVFFRINNVVFNKNNVFINGDGYPNDEVTIIIDLSKWDGYSQDTKPYDKIKKSFIVQGPDHSLQNFSLQEKIKFESENDQYRIDVYNTNHVLLETTRGIIANNWPTKSEVTNPFSTVFEKFVTYKQLREMLIEFKADDMKDSSAIYERGISWLLSLMDLKTIWLSKYEKTGDATHRASIDVLSSDSKNSVILVNATIGIPDSSDFARERRSRESITNLVSNPSIKFTSVLFSGASVKGLNEKAFENGVKLIGRDEIEQILNSLQNGNVNSARQFVLSEEF